MISSTSFKDQLSFGNEIRKDPELKVRITVELVRKERYGENIMRTFRKDVTVNNDSSFGFFEKEIRAIIMLYEQGRVRI